MLVGAAGFEPAAPCSQSWGRSQDFNENSVSCCGVPARHLNPLAPATECNPARGRGRVRRIALDNSFCSVVCVRGGTAARSATRKWKRAPTLLSGARQIPVLLRRVRPDQLQARKLAVQEHPSNQARHPTRRSGCASSWCVGIDVKSAVPERNGHQMGPRERTTNHIPGVTADRRETIPLSDNSPVSGQVPDPPLTNHQATGLRQRFPGLIPARPYCAVRGNPPADGNEGEA